MGAWKNYDELEESLSLDELFTTLDAIMENKNRDRSFLAAVNDKSFDTGDPEEDKTNTWEDIKARAFSGGRAKDAKDILALSGQNAQLKGFGIGNGLEYYNSDNKPWWDE